MSLFLALVLICAAVPAALASSGVATTEEHEPGYVSIEEMIGFDSSEWPKTMYVYTDNGGTLNVRSEPRTGDNVIAKLDYGAKVIVEGPVMIDTSWYCIRHSKGNNGVAYVMARFLIGTKPKDADKKAEEAEQKKNLEELNRQMASFKTLDKPIMISVRAARASGWVNFRVGPGVAADRIASLPDGRELKAIGETDKWYQAIDLETNKTGFISKNYVTVLPTKAEEEAPAKTQMGKLNVNGEFTLQCALPTGYSMQLINTLGTKINAFITSESKTKPILQLSIAFNELYADVDRMNDLSEEELKALEATFTEMNDVEISYRETSYGTKLLIAREVGDDTDFVDILSVYKGYQIEFVMTPNPEAKKQTLTDKQIQMCIDFLSELDFVPVTK